MKTRRKSQITHKIISRIMIIGLTGFIITSAISYITLVPPLRSRALKNVQNVNSKIITQTDYLLSHIQNYADGITTSKELKTSLINYVDNPYSESNYELVRLSLNKFAGTGNNIRCIFIETDSGKMFDSIAQIDNADLELLKTGWYESIRETDNAEGFSKLYTVDSNGKDVYTGAYCKNFSFYTHRLTITIFFRATEIINLTRVLAENNLDSFQWMDSGNNPFYLSDTEVWSQGSLKKFNDISLYNFKQFKESGKHNFINISPKSKWVLVSFISDSSLVNTFIKYFISVVMLFVLLFFFITIILTPMIINIIRPLGRLASVMNEVAGGNLDVVSDVHTDDEIGKLSRIFNSMISELKKHIKTIIAKEKMEQHVKYSLLISQMDPHFIYNTMSSINYLARKGRTQDIITVNSALIKILQDRLRVNKIEIMDTIEQEVEIVKQYMIIQSYRHENKVEIIWDIDASLKNVEIPKNIIQPLVENALLHGLTDEENGQISGIIKISIYRSGKNILIKVFDNGRGINVDKLEQLNLYDSYSNRDKRGKHIGIANIRTRLFYFYGECDCLKIESTPSDGTCVTLVLKPDQKRM